jgi:hypothetical protein
LTQEIAATTLVMQIASIEDAELVQGLGTSREPTAADESATGPVRSSSGLRRLSVAV